MALVFIDMTFWQLLDTTSCCQVKNWFRQYVWLLNCPNILVKLPIVFSKSQNMQYLRKLMILTQSASQKQCATSHRRLLHCKYYHPFSYSSIDTDFCAKELAHFSPAVYCQSILL
jgi:hypothetical protein